jgi:hypothetical protein
MIFIGAGLLVLAVLAFFVTVKLGNWARRKWDAHTVLSHSRNVERDAQRREREREEQMRRYVMDELRPARKS